MTNLRLLVPFVVVVSVLPLGASTALLKQGSVVQVQIDRDVKMRVGQPVHARTVSPIFIDNQLVVPAGSEVIGKITELHPVEHKVSMDAKLHGDFTPLHRATIQFDTLRENDSTTLSLHSTPASDGTPVVRFQSADALQRQQSLPKRLWSDMMGREKETVETFTAPGKWDRVKKVFYSRLPVHPQSVDRGLEYTFELSQPVQVPVATSVIAFPTKAEEKLDQSAVIHARLLTAVDSKDDKRGKPVTAVVTEPLFDAKGQLRVPQDTLLVGQITEAQAAGKRGKNGVLRFAFHELQFPAGFRQPVQGSPVAIDSDRRANLGLDAEGGVKPERPGVIAPLAMGLLTAAALQEDEASVLHAGAASNGFGLAARVIALATASRYVGAAVGAFGTGRSLYTRFIGHGTDVSFEKNTRVEIAIDPVKSPIMRLDEKH